MPQQDVPRETFIALRARRQAYRIATDFLYRDAPPEPTDVLPAEIPYAPRREPAMRRFIKSGAMVLLAVILLSFVVLLLVVGTIGLSQPVRLR